MAKCVLSACPDRPSDSRSGVLEIIGRPTGGEESQVRRRHSRYGTDLVTQPDDVSPCDATVTAIDAALTFTASRELLTQKQVTSLFDTLRLASSLSEEAGRTYEAVIEAVASFADRRLVSSTELTDALLDLRLRLRVPLNGASEAWPPESAANPRIRV
jgi:hypothetical protein